MSPPKSGHQASGRDLACLYARSIFIRPSFRLPLETTPCSGVGVADTQMRLVPEMIIPPGHGVSEDDMWRED